MSTDEEKQAKREADRKRWDEREDELNERRLRISKMEEQRAKIHVECSAVDLEYAKARLKSMTAQELYWRAVGAHPGEHDALFRKVLEEVQLMRSDIKDQKKG